MSRVADALARAHVTASEKGGQPAPYSGAWPSHAASFPRVPLPESPGRRATLLHRAAVAAVITAGIAIGAGLAGWIFRDSVSSILASHKPSQVFVAGDIDRR